MIEGSGSIPRLVDPDPGGQKTRGYGGCGYGGFGSGTLPGIVSAHRPAAWGDWPGPSSRPWCGRGGPCSAARCLPPAHPATAKLLSLAVLWIHEILLRIRIRMRIQILLYIVSDLQDVKKITRYRTFTSFFIFQWQKVIKKSKNNRNRCFFLLFLLHRRIRSGSLSLTNGSGSGRPENIWIPRIRIRIRIRNTALQFSSSEKPIEEFDWNDFCRSMNYYLKGKLSNSVLWKVLPLSRFGPDFLFRNSPV